MTARRVNLHILCETYTQRTGKLYRRAIFEHFKSKWSQRVAIVILRITPVDSGIMRRDVQDQRAKHSRVTRRARDGTIMVAFLR